MPLGVIPQIVLTEGGVDFQSLYAVGYDSLGNVIPLLDPVVWSSDNPSVCQPGVFSGAFGEACQVTGGNTPGMCTVTVLSGNGVSATASIEVDAVPPPPPPPPQPLAALSIEVGVEPASVARPAVKRFFGIKRKR